MKNALSLNPKAWLLAGLLFPAVANATNYYVSPTGDDANPGSITLPFQTITAAVQAATTPGDEVRVTAGVYPEIVPSAASGDAINPIKVLALGNVTVTAFLLTHAYNTIEGFQLTGSDLTNLAHIELFDGADHSVIQFNTIANSAFDNVGGIEIWSSVQDCTIRGNTIKNILGVGLIIRGQSHLVQNNTLSDLHGYTAIQALGHNHLISSNRIEHSPDTRAVRTPPASVIRTWGLLEEGSTNISFVNNLINDFEGYAAFLEENNEMTSLVGNWTISNNIFANTTRPFRMAIPNSTISNNTFYKVGSGTDPELLLEETLINEKVYSTADGVTVRNNVFVTLNAGGSQLDYYQVGSFVSPALIDYNFVTSSPEGSFAPKSSFEEPHGLNGGDPLFTNINQPLDGGLRPTDFSQLCQSNGNPAYGALPCSCTVTTPSAVPLINYSSTPGSRQITFDGSKSHSCGQLITSYSWNFGDGQTSTSVSGSHTYVSGGTKTVILAITNQLNQQGSLSTEVTLPADINENKAPTFAAKEPDRIVYLPDKAFLNQTIAQDDNFPNPPSTLTYGWTVLSGPANVVFDSSSSLHTIASFSTVGTYVLQLRVSDSLLSAAATTQIDVRNFPNVRPLVYGGSTKTVTLPDTLTITDSYVADDNLPTPTVNISWAAVNPPGSVTFNPPNAATTTVTFGAPGVYTLVLTASDTEFISSTTATVEVFSGVPTNRAPSVVASSAPIRIVFPSDLAALTEVKVSDDGFPNPPGELSFLWSKDSGPGTVTFSSTFTQTTFASFSDPGTYVVRLTASDSFFSAFATMTIITTSFPAQPPVVEAGPYKIVPIPPGSYTPQATVSVDTGSYIASWIQVSGPALAPISNPNILQPNFTFISTGSYVFRLTAQQGLAVASDDLQLDVRQGRLLTVVGGWISETGLTSQYVGVGATVTITSDFSGPGVTFDGWTGYPVDTPSSPEASFVMPDHDVVITGTYHFDQPSQQTGFLAFSNVLDAQNPTLFISYQLTSASHVTMTVQTMLGEEVRVLVSDYRDFGFSSASWDGKNGSGSQVASGLYVLVLRTDQGTYTSKVAVTR